MLASEITGDRIGKTQFRVSSGDTMSGRCAYEPRIVFGPPTSNENRVLSDIRKLPDFLNLSQVSKIANVLVKLEMFTGAFGT